MLYEVITLLSSPRAPRVARPLDRGGGGVGRDRGARDDGQRAADPDHPWLARVVAQSSLSS